MGIAKALPVDVGNDRGYRPGRLMFMVAGLTGPILSYSRVFEVERWSRKTMVYLRGCHSQPRQRIRDETMPSL